MIQKINQTAFDYEIQNGTPVATDATSSNWKIPLTITATANKNMELASQYFRSTLLALSLVPEEVTLYKELNKDVYTVDLSGSSSIALRRVQSFEMLEKLVGNLPENYPRLYAVDSGLDRKIGLGAMNRESHRFYQMSARDKRLEISFLAASRQAATFSYDDQRSLDEINKLTGYWVKPLGVTSRVMVGDVYNPVTKKTWMDRNLGALWVPLTATDGGGYGSYYTFEEAQTACPAGYRLPTDTEWKAEFQSWSSNNAVGAYASPLRLPLAGHRSDNGNFYNVGEMSFWWSSKLDNTSYLFFGTLFYELNRVRMHSNYLADGYSVRCIKD